MKKILILASIFLASSLMAEKAPIKKKLKQTDLQVLLAFKIF